MLSLIKNCENALHWLSNAFSNVFYNIAHLPAVVSSAYDNITSAFDVFPSDFVFYLDFFLAVALLLKLVRW